MSRETLNTQFWKAAKILRQDDNTNSLLDYVEQISWLLFLKCFEELEKRHRDEAEFNGETYRQIIADKYQWSYWTNSDPSKKLRGQALLKFLNNDLFPHLRNLKGSNGRSVIQALFEEAPSKMLKDGNILRDAIDAIQEIQFESVDDIHTLSHLYESLLAKLGREGGFGGEFYTPRLIIEFVVNMVDPKLGETVYDPAMGSAGFLVEAYKHMRADLGTRIQPDDERILQRETFFGQEKKPLPYLLGCMNMILHGVLTPSLNRRNTLADDVRKFTEKDRFDVILTNPPFGGTEHESVTANFRYPSKATSITFLQHIMAKVKRGGHVGMVIDDTVLSKTTENAYVDTRKELLENFNLHTVVLLPAGVFANAVSSGSGPKTALIFFDRELDEAGKPIGTKDVWYYEVSAVGFSLTKTQRPTPENDLPDCFNKAKLRTVSAQSWLVPFKDIASHNYDLSMTNPNPTSALIHHSPLSITSSIANHFQKAIEILDEVQEFLDHDAERSLKEYPEIQLSEVIQQRKEPIRIEDDKHYRRVTVQLHARGITLRDEVLGNQIKTKTQYPIKATDLLVAEIDAKVGGYGIVPAELEGAIVSGHYYLYEVDTSRINLKFLEYWLKTPEPLLQIKDFVKGALNYASIRPKHFPSLIIHLPDMQEQQRIVAKLDKAQELVDLHRKITIDTSTLMPALLDKAFRGEL